MIPTGSRTVVAEICYHNITEPLATTCRSAPIVLRAHWLTNGSRQKFIARGYHTTGADLCTTSSKKHELNLSKARSAGAISMSLLVPLLEFNHFDQARALAGDSNPVLALTYYQLGLDYYKKRDADKSEELLHEALDIQRADPNVDPRDLANTLFMLSYATAAATGNDAALPLAKEAYDVLKANSPNSKTLSDIKKWIEELSKR